LTIAKSPALMRNTDTISSVMLPSVAFSRPPRRAPTRVATCSVERPIKPASGMIARAELTNKATVRPRKSAAIETGMKTNSQSIEGVNLLVDREEAKSGQA